MATKRRERDWAKINEGRYDADAHRRRNWKHKYGITPEQYDEMLEAQGGVCAVCYRPDNARGLLSVDHDHATNRVRGLLCNSCNTALGSLGDDPDRLRRAADYLELPSLLCPT